LNELKIRQSQRIKPKGFPQRQLLLFLLLVTPYILTAQKSIHSVKLSIGKDSISNFSNISKYRDTYYTLSKNDRYIFSGTNPDVLHCVDLKSQFKDLVTRSQLKEELDSSYSNIQWDEIYYQLRNFIYHDGAIHLVGTFAVEYLVSDYRMPLLQWFLIELSPQGNPVKLKALHFDPKDSYARLRYVSSHPLFPNGPILELNYNDELSALPYLHFLKDDSMTIRPEIAYNQKLSNVFNLSISTVRWTCTIEDSSLGFSKPTHLYSTGLEIIDLNTLKPLFISDSLYGIYSVPMKMNGELCVMGVRLNEDETKIVDFKMINILTKKMSPIPDAFKMAGRFVYHLDGRIENLNRVTLLRHEGLDWYLDTIELD
jgi:hypothetical protein